MASKYQSRVPIEKKILVTVPEGSELSGIGQNKLSALLRMPNCPFVLFVGNKKLIKRREFEQFISSVTEI